MWCSTANVDAHEPAPEAEGEHRYVHTTELRDDEVSELVDEDEDRDQGDC